MTCDFNFFDGCPFLVGRARSWSVNSICILLMTIVQAGYWTSCRRIEFWTLRE